MHHDLSLPVRSPAYPSAGRSPILTMAGVAVRRDGIDILYDVSLTLRAGEIYGLLGPNGAGKSTAIAAALGLLPRHAGTVAVFGLDPAVDGHAIQARVGLLPERPGSLDRMTAAEYLGYFARLHRESASHADIDRCLELVGLELRSGQVIGTFSRGMQQRLAIARALVADPELLILEHPTDGLDPDAQRRLQDLLRELAVRRGMAILLSTHRLDEAELLCSRIGILMQGRTTVEGRLSELLANPSHTGRAAPEVSSSGHDLLAAGWPTMDLAAPRRALEELYRAAATRAGHAGSGFRMNKIG